MRPRYATEILRNKNSASLDFPTNHSREALLSPAKALPCFFMTAFFTQAPYSVTSELCDAAMLLFPARGDRTRSIVEWMADVQMLRIIRGHAER